MSRAALLALALSAVAMPVRAQADDVHWQVECKSAGADGAVRHFDIRLIPEGNALITDRDAETPSPVEASTYVNAFVWHDGPDTWLFNRFNGLLTKNKVETFQCAKVGAPK